MERQIYTYTDLLIDMDKIGMLGNGMLHWTVSYGKINLLVYVLSYSAYITNTKNTNIYLYMITDGEADLLTYR